MYIFEDRDVYLHYILSNLNWGIISLVRERFSEKVGILILDKYCMPLVTNTHIATCVLINVVVTWCRL